MANVDSDPWHYARPELAEQYVRHYGPVQSLTLFSERRTGKTSFVKRDLAPEAAKQGYQPVYVDLWTHKKNATTALVDGLRTAALELKEPKTRLGKVLSQPVEGLSIPGLGSVDLGGIPSENEPDDPLLRIGHWSNQIVENAKRPVLLIVDEIQQIGVDRDGDATAAALRSALQRHDRKLLPFFTGSSADRLAGMFYDTGASFYQFGSQVNFPPLDRGFVEHIADRHKESARGDDLDREALWSAFQALDNKPGPFREMVQSLLVAAETDVAKYLDTQQRQEEQRTERGLAVKELSPIQIGVLTRLAHDLPLFSQDARAYYGDFAQEDKPMNSARVYRAVESLKNKQLVHSGSGRADYRLSSQALGRVLREKYPEAGADQSRAAHGQNTPNASDEIER